MFFVTILALIICYTFCSSDRRPNNLRTLIHDATKRAEMLKSLKSIYGKYMLVYDQNTEFVVFHLVENKGSPSEIISEKDDNSKSLKSFIPLSDPLDINTLDPNLLIYNFAISIDDYAEQEKKSYSIVLNKFNSIKEHCLLLSNDFISQLLPLSIVELELWNWILLETNAVGFYNSNAIAGASQKHRHFQFIPLDRIWSLRNPDAPHALPIDDMIIPKIESGDWLPYPDQFSAVNNQKLKYLTNKSYLYKLHNFDFQHSLAVLSDRSSISFTAATNHNNTKHGSSSSSDSSNLLYGAYLKHVYESLLSDNGISLQALKTCSSSSIVNDSSQETNNSSCDDNEQQLEVAYNLIFTSQYMIVVPRQSKAFKDAGASTYNQNIEINSFGFLGMLMASSDRNLALIEEIGPLTIIKSVAKPWITKNSV